MKRKIMAVLGIMALVVGVAACSGQNVQPSSNAENTGSSQQEITPEPQPADLTGTWKSTNSDSEDSWMEATITSDTIQIDWVTADTRSLYWIGTFETPGEPGDWSWTSQADREKMDTALMASQDDTKDFTYTETDGLSFDASAMGVTKTVKMAKQ
ncbi:hypothetical protein H6A14_02095 [Bifidobacterium pullorum subsp. saeculare]|uniref:hypothetical protein n=1 Tax=Bifidobacterium pullorum TaxID=78448 RepID=UPI0019569261|nr:hypothetical protein [Bifidobacterium pullorum]MBM6729984.1 hypothetical protein [Bifidobacterium pullorum subsp. saeculare]